MDFLKLLRFHLIYFQLYGFYPSKIVKTVPPTVDKTVAWSLTIFNLTFIFVQTAVVYYYSHYIFTNPRVLGNLPDICRYLIVAMSCYYILIESILTIDDQNSFWSILFNIQKNYETIFQTSSMTTQNRIYKKNILKTYVLLLTYICVQIFLTICRSCPFCNAYNVLVFYAYNRCLQYILYVDIIHQQAVNLECELDRLIKISKYMSESQLNTDGKRKLREFLVNRLRVASSFYVGLYEMSVKVNNAFGWSLVINLLHSFMNISMEFYWMFQMFVEGRKEYFVETSASMMPSLLVVAFVFYTTIDCHSKVHDVKIKAKSIRENENTNELSTMIHNFILQTQHQAITFDAKGFFAMDFAPIRHMIGSIATFMVFIIQSSEKFEE